MVSSSVAAGDWRLYGGGRRRSFNVSRWAKHKGWCGRTHMPHLNECYSMRRTNDNNGIANDDDNATIWRCVYNHFNVCFCSLKNFERLLWMYLSSVVPSMPSAVERLPLLILFGLLFFPHLGCTSKWKLLSFTVVYLCEWAWLRYYTRPNSKINSQWRRSNTSHTHINNLNIWTFVEWALN